MRTRAAPPDLREDVRVDRDAQLQETSGDGTAATPALRRLGLVVHPRRAIEAALTAVRDWAAVRGAEIVQVQVAGQGRVVADPGEVSSCDLVLAVGGDGTALAALHAAARFRRPVLGVACGSLGALTATSADNLRDALECVAAGDWRPRRLGGLEVSEDVIATRVAINDVVVVRRGASQVAIEINVDGQRYARYGGDGIVIATPLGSSAYTMASGGPIMAPGAEGFVLSPLAPHGGSCPPLVVGSASEVTVTVEPGWFGARLEFDGQAVEEQPRLLTVTRVENYATLVSLGSDEPMLAGLRRRRIVMDSPRVLARDDREAAGR
jgi:NAD+ kinase